MSCKTRSKWKSTELKYTANALYRKSSKQIFPEMKLRGLVPILYIHVRIWELFIPTIGPQMQYRKIAGPIVGMYKSFTDTWMQIFGRSPRSFISGNICFEFSVQCRFVLITQWNRFFSTLLHQPLSESTVSEAAGIEPRTVTTSALAVRRSNYSYPRG